MIYFDMDFRLEADEIDALIAHDARNKDEYYHHAPDGTYHNLDFLGLPEELYSSIVDRIKIKPDKVTLVTVPQHGVVPRHHDGKYGRETVIIFPITPYGENYAPCTIYESDVKQITFRPCYAFNTQCEHSVENNEFRRTSLQLWYNKSIEEIWANYIRNEL